MHTTNIIKRLPQTFAVRNLWMDAFVQRREGRERVVPTRVVRKEEKPIEKAVDEVDESQPWPRKIFSGIQPTGAIHLGNYLGAVQKWTALQNSKQDVTYCIVDLHSITLPQDPSMLRNNILQMAATMLACGIDPDKATIFVQSAVKEHSELCWILNCNCTMARLGHLPQYREKARTLKDIPMGLYIYPVLQAADIMLYKSTHVPVGEDQIQHIQLTQHLAKTFNTKYGDTFPICHAIIDDKDAARIRSLRDPSKKMSKSDPDTRATVNLIDSSEQITEKIKKAMTDFTADVTYDPVQRPGVSNLIAIHSLVTGQNVNKIVEEANSLNTAAYKMRVAEAVVEHLSPIRSKIAHHMSKPNELIQLLDVGARKAREIAQQTMMEVRLKVGLGAHYIPALVHLQQESKLPVQDLKKDNQKEAIAKKKPADRPAVPQQNLRMEKPKRFQMEIRAEMKVQQKPAQTTKLQKIASQKEQPKMGEEQSKMGEEQSKVAEQQPSSQAETTSQSTELQTTSKEEGKAKSASDSKSDDEEKDTDAAAAATTAQQSKQVKI